MKEQAKRRPSPNEKLVRVFDAERETEVMLVRGLLESAGIDCDVTSLDAQQDILPGVGGTVILVREEDVATALRLIEDIAGYRVTVRRSRLGSLVKRHESSEWRSSPHVAVVDSVAATASGILKAQ